MCPVPDPVNHADGKPEPSKVFVSGGNLGGVANPGFVGDEHDDRAAGESALPVGGDAVTEATNPALAEGGEEEEEEEGERSEADAGYTRNRNFGVAAGEGQPRDGDGGVGDGGAAVLEVPVAEHGAKEQQQQQANNVVFFVHGVGGSADIWSSQLAFFAAEVGRIRIEYRQMHCQHHNPQRLDEDGQYLMSLSDNTSDF